MTRPTAKTVATVGLFGLLAFCGDAGCAPNRGAAYEKALAEARVAQHDGRFESAAEHFDEAARTANVKRDGVYARYEAALARARSGDVARAARELRAIADDKAAGDYAAQAALKAGELAWKSDPAAGAAELEAMALRFPETGVARVALLRVLRQDDEAGPEAALAHLDALLPKVAKTSLEQDVLYERAKRIADLKRTAAARDAFLDVAARFPYPKGNYFDDALYRASEMEEALGRYEAAIEHLERMLSFREKSVTIGSYERPRYSPAILRIAQLEEERLHDRARARATLHRLYTDFRTSTMRDDALWREAELWRKDGDSATACDRLASLVSDFPDSRYVPCAIDRCPGTKRPSKSKAPKECHAYLTKEAPASTGEAAP